MPFRCGNCLKANRLRSDLSADEIANRLGISPAER
jgi:transcriptional regulator with XRE-family HTH domain